MVLVISTAKLTITILDLVLTRELHVTIQRNQPPLINIDVPHQTPVGIYTIPLVVTIREPSMATTTKPTFIAPQGGTVDPKFELSKSIQL